MQLKKPREEKGFSCECLTAWRDSPEGLGNQAREAPRGCCANQAILLTKISFLLKGAGGKISFHFLTMTYSQERALVGKFSVTFSPWFHGWLSRPARSPRRAFRLHQRDVRGTHSGRQLHRALVTYTPPSTASVLLGPSLWRSYIKELN